MILEAHQEKGEGRAPIGGVKIRDPVSEATPKLHEVVGKGKAVVTEEQVAHSLVDLSKKKRTTDQFILVRRDQTPPDSTTGPSSQPDDDTSDKVIHESSSTSDSERTESETETAAPKDDKDQGEVDSSTVTSGVSIPVSDPVKAHEALAGPDPEPMKEDQTGSDSGKLHVSLAGPNPEHMDDEFLATAYPKVHENLKLITDERVIDDKPESQSGSMSSMKNLDDTFNFGDQFLYDKPLPKTNQEKSSSLERSMIPPIPDTIHQVCVCVSTPPVIAPFTDVSSTQPSSLVTPPPINTEATTITTSLPEITPFIALQLRVARLEQEMSEVKKTDHQADVLASIKSQVPTAVDKYLGTKLDDALLKILERHTADFIVKIHLWSAGPKSLLRNQESERVRRRLFRAKKGTRSRRNKSQITPSDKGKDLRGKAMIVMMMKDDDVDDKGPSITDTRRGLVLTLHAQSDPESIILIILQDDISMRDKGNDSDMEDTDNAHIPKLKAARYLDFGLEELVPSLWVESEREYDISAVYGITHWWFRRKEFYINKHSESSDREAVRSQMRILSVISVKVFEKYGYNYLREIILHRVDYQEYKISEKDFKNLHPNDFEDLFLLNIQEKLNHLPKTDKTSLHTAVNMWIRNLVIRNRVGDLQLGIESYQTKINLERPNWDAADYYFKEDYTIVPKPRAVVYRDRNDQRKLMRLNELHKFSDGTLTRVMEKLDQMVKDFHLYEYNKGMETRKWSEDGQEKKQSVCVSAIEKRFFFFTVQKALSNSRKLCWRKNKRY
ncbi:hypothetical protein Tco_0499770 [Tanacetum coccineum]